MVQRHSQALVRRVTTGPVKLLDFVTLLLLRHGEPPCPARGQGRSQRRQLGGCAIVRLRVDTELGRCRGRAHLSLVSVAVLCFILRVRVD